MEKLKQKSTVLINRAALKCVCVCVTEREIDVEAPADFWPLTALLCWRFYPRVKQQLSAHHFSTTERTGSVMNIHVFVNVFM